MTDHVLDSINKFKKRGFKRSEKSWVHNDGTEFHRYERGDFAFEICVNHDKYITVPNYPKFITRLINKKNELDLNEFTGSDKFNGRIGANVIKEYNIPLTDEAIDLLCDLYVNNN